MSDVMSKEPREGYLDNGIGHFMRRDAIQPRVLREHDLVETLIAEAEAMQGLLSLFKVKCFDDIRQFREEVASRYGASVGGTRGGLSLHSFDGRLRVTVSEADSLTFGPELEAAKALIDECLQEWTADGNANLRAVIDSAFNVGEGRKIRMDRVLGLRSIQINDERWMHAMAAINDAVRTERSKLYVRFYRREKPEDQFTLIVLDLARVP